MDTAKCAEAIISSEGNAAAENREDKLEAYEIDEVEVPDCGSEDIDFEHCRIKSINHLNRFPNVKRLCLRNNLIKCLENFTPVASTLHELDLYDNQITKASFGFMCFLIFSTLCSRYPYLLCFPCNRSPFLAITYLYRTLQNRMGRRSDKVLFGCYATQRNMSRIVYMMLGCSNLVISG
ncbi:uncharacterized protein DEA37_0014484 [Paragonimus westermani]|uniref:Uncharacterized protein n=1 Tax=Paragonimus westermani TaxID=34504 RepID=A0A5J4NAL4_9TREM|nr:uncharacterized protein DEA37_0014484 [Paragonimus westermani]